MSQLGARFREAREARGLTLAEAASNTRILARYLQALEEGDYEQLPGDVYARGFIRNYAQFLELPADELIQVYRRERGAPTDKIKVVPAAVPPRTRSCLLPSAFFSFFSILVLLGLLYLLAQWTGLTRQPTSVIAGGGTATATTTVEAPTQWATPTLQPEGSQPSRLPPTPSPTLDPNAPPPTPAPPPGPTPDPQFPLVVEIRIAPDAARGSWMNVLADGQQAYNGTLLANASKVITAQREVFVHAGDGSVVEVIVNGQSRGRLGTVQGGVVKTTIPLPNPTGSAP